MPAAARPRGQPPKRNDGGAAILTIDVFQSICRTLRECGGKYKSCEAHGWNWDHVRTVLKQNPEWQALWDEALDQFREGLEQEAKSRAVDGWDEPIFYKGSPVGYITRKSDRILELLLRANFPEKYRDNVHHTGNISDAPTLDLSALSQEARDAVRVHLQAIRDIVNKDLGIIEGEASPVPALGKA